MRRIRIIKKNDEYSQEYEVGDVFETEGTWYGEFIFPGEPEFRYLWIKRSIQNLDQNQRRLQ